METHDQNPPKNNSCITCGGVVKRKNRRTCNRCTHKKFDANNPGKRAEYMRRHYAAFRTGEGITIERRMAMAKVTVRNRRKRPWELTAQQYSDLISPNRCHYCTGPLFRKMGIGLDRIDNNKGYSIDNVLPCCFQCNVIRGNHMTVEETEVVVRALMEFRKAKNAA